MASWIGRLQPFAGALKSGPRLFVAYLATGLLFLVPLMFQGPMAEQRAKLVSARIEDGRGNWHGVDLQTLTLPRDRISVAKIVLRLDPATLASGEPLGLYLSG